jgi:hypothetical protein
MGIVGAGPLMPDIDDLVEMQNLSNTILVGQVDFRELAAHYSASDLTYAVYDAKDRNPHIVMSLPAKVIEPLQIGVPVVVAKNLAMPKFVGKWQFGLATEESQARVGSAILTLR